MMFIKLCVILLVLQVTNGQDKNHNWDVAVVVDDEIEFLKSDGQRVGRKIEQFTKLKALTFDNVRHQFVVSDMDQNYGNDTIFSVQLNKETAPTPIIQDLPDDVQGLAIDPITDTLYWTDSKNHSINYASLNSSSYMGKNLLQFDSEQKPAGVAIDVCRRYIYWTNSNIYNSTIERSTLDGKDRKVLVDSDLNSPVGIAIDYKAQRLYWTDILEGIYFSIESTNLEGKEREIIYKGTHGYPYGIAVDEKAIYFTDINNNALYRISKHNKGTTPELIRQYHEKPHGVIAKNLEITTLPDCKILEEAMKVYNESLEVFEEPEEDTTNSPSCLNGGKSIGDRCKCLMGYTGRNCEISLCHNFCFRGSCHLSQFGYPECHCPNGFVGKRCERNLCNEYCFNGGECSYTENSNLPECLCQKDYSGSRCEIKMDFTHLCALYCKENNDDVLTSKEDELICSCTEDSYIISSSNITTQEFLRSDIEDNVLMEKLRDSWFMGLFSMFLLAIVIIFVLSGYICCVRKRRPRIKKRIIVSKNVQPLTYRPQPNTEQCEITIENCCNMNVCETPCFDPPTFRSFQKNDDTKKLLSHMEHADD